MRHLAQLQLALLLLPFSARIEAQQADQLATDQLATLEGKVIEAGTQSPVRKASVSLSSGSQGSSAELVATTDETGVFRFADLKQGDYILTVEKIGFLPGGYGVTKPKEPRRPLTLKSGEHRGDLVLPLFQAGNISGRVLDGDGDPLPNRTVMLWKKRRWKRNTGQDRPQDEVSTNQAGEYRFAGLEPGSYFVSAQEEHNPGENKVLVDRDGRPTQLHELTTYFPDSLSAVDSQSVAVEAGQENGGDRRSCAARHCSRCEGANHGYDRICESLQSECVQWIGKLGVSRSHLRERRICVSRRAAG